MGDGDGIFLWCACQLCAATIPARLCCDPNRHWFRTRRNRGVSYRFSSSVAVVRVTLCDHYPSNSSKARRAGCETSLGSSAFVGVVAKSTVSSPTATRIRRFTSHEFLLKNLGVERYPKDLNI